jgi:tetratricopeptide (TPR) repeat protein
MSWCGAPVRLISFQAIAILVSILLVSPSSRAAADEQVCDVRSDYALGLEDYPKAIALHRQLLQSDSGNALAHYHLGFAYSMVGDSSNEISEYLEAVRLGLQQWDLFMNLGLAYLERDEKAQAIDAFETAVSLGPGHSEAHFNLALAYERSNRLSDALREISTSLRLAPQDPDARNTRAIIFAELGDQKNARAEWLRLVRAEPDYAPARANLAILNHSSAPPPQLVQRAEAPLTRRLVSAAPRH